MNGCIDAVRINFGVFKEVCVGHGVWCKEFQVSVLTGQETLKIRALLRHVAHNVDCKLHYAVKVEKNYILRRLRSAAREAKVHRFSSPTSDKFCSQEGDTH